MYQYVFFVPEFSQNWAVIIIPKRAQLQKIGQKIHVYVLLKFDTTSLRRKYNYLIYRVSPFKKKLCV